MSIDPKEMYKNPIIKKIAPQIWEEKDTGKQPAIHICNYYFLDLDMWEYPKNFGQYWRLYWNQKKGAQIFFQNEVYEMTPNKVFLIPSHVATSTPLNKHVPHFSINFKVSGKFEEIKHKIFIMKPDFLYLMLPEFAKLKNETARLMMLRLCRQ